MSEGELKKRICHIIEREGKETNQSYRGKYHYQAVSKFVEKIVDEAFKDFPSCETCPIPKLPIPAQHCYNARHQYPSECPKDKWFEKWFGSVENREGLR